MTGLSENGPGVTAAIPGGIEGTLTTFAAELRATGIAVQLPEVVDAAEALRLLPVPDYRAVRSALACTMVKDSSQLPAFGLLFDVFFGTGDTIGDGRPAAAPAGGVLGRMDDAGLVAAAEQALRRNDQLTLRRLAAAAVERFSGFEPGRAVAGKLYLSRTLRALDLDGMVERQAADGHAPRQLRRRAEEFSREVEAAIRRTLVNDRGAVAVAQTLRPALPGAAEFLNASPAELRQLDSAIGPLARTLSLRLSRRRGNRHGQVDLRATLRKSVTTGGAPVELRYKRARPPRPEVIVLADVSGSVAAFAQFTFRLLAAMRARLPKLRCFAFLDDVAEVTDVILAAPSLGAAAAQVIADPRLVWLDGHSDYGHVLTRFRENWSRTLGPRSIVLVLGDARTNYQDPHPEVLAALRRQAGRVYWLNPEPARYWGTGDSAAGQYAPHCDRFTECRNVGQLREFVGGLDV